MLPASVGTAFSRFTVTAVALAAAAACSPDAPPPPPADDLAAEFIGSAGCAGCHESAFAEWRGSHHELAMQHASDDTVLGDFNGVVVDYFGEQSRFSKQDGRFLIQTPGADGEDSQFEILYTFGVEPLQQYLVALEGGRLQALPWSWDTRPASAGGQRWFHLYPDEKILPGDELHWSGQQQNWNFMCAECHSTDLQMRYDRASRSFDTTWSEVSVGCEACHGPGSNHIAQAEQGSFAGNFGLAVDLDDRSGASWVMNTGTGIAERSAEPAHDQYQPEACGRCHARRAPIAAEYEYGRPLTDTHVPSLIENGLYYADGQIRDEVYVYGSFLQSAMYRAGVTCSDCHNPHSLALHTGPRPEDVCAQCHLPARFGSTEHTGHELGTVSCVDCHMPATTYMVVDDRRDHSFRIPRPDLTQSAGAPNACNACHGDRDAQWASAAIEDWHGSSRPAEFATVLASAWRQPANPDLVSLYRDAQMPGIARATALSLLGQPLTGSDENAIRNALAEEDPLLRIAALDALRTSSADVRLQLAPRLLDDEIRGVRFAAGQALVDVATQLPQSVRGRLETVLAEYRESMLVTANRPESLTNLGNLDAMTGRYEAAESWYLEALSIEPRYSMARINMADMLRQTGRDDRGEPVLLEGIRLNESDAMLHHTLGLLYVRQARYDEALASLRRSVALDPSNGRFAYVLGVALNSVDSRDAAIEFAEDYLLENPADTTMQQLLQSLIQEAGQAVPD